MEHVSVLKKEVQKYLDLKGGEIVLDATLGLGGHAKDILKNIGVSGELIAFESDERNLFEAQSRLKEYKNQITYCYDNFRHLKTRIATNYIGKIDAVLFDLGLSSPHVDEAERGFSFLKEGPLDMRFDSRNTLIAADIVNNYKIDRLISIFFEYGEERHSKKIAQMICDRRKEKKFSTTTDLAEFIKKIMPIKYGHHPATRIFQALRIEVNDELNALKEALNQAVEVLKIGGRIVVISYHSLEDRIVKDFFKKLMHPPASKEQLMFQAFGDPIFQNLTKKVVIPTEEEIIENPRSRSAKLRAYIKLKEIEN